jgi:hypothetical protein
MIGTSTNITTTYKILFFNDKTNQWVSGSAEGYSSLEAAKTYAEKISNCYHIRCKLHRVTTCVTTEEVPETGVITPFKKQF